MWPVNDSRCGFPFALAIVVMLGTFMSSSTYFATLVLEFLSKVRSSYRRNCRGTGALRMFKMSVSQNGGKLLRL
jgi:hypothetical protein